MGIWKKAVESWVFLVVLIKVVESTSFTYNSFSPYSRGLIYQGDAQVPYYSTDLQLTGSDSRGRPASNRVGRVIYSTPILFWDTKRQADFQTSVKFGVKPSPNTRTDPADGIAFEISSVHRSIASDGARIEYPEIPSEYSGGNLGIFNCSGMGSSLFAVEFDTYVNDAWDPPHRHVGIDVNSRVSKNTTEFDPVGGVVTASISYDSSTKTVTVTATSDASGTVTVSYEVDLKTVLTGWVQVGLSASTGEYGSIQEIYSWSFSSTLVDQDQLYLALN